jgi:hypothetical protein
MLSNIEKEKLVIDLYYNQHKNVRQIAQEARMSFRDIAAILKKKEEAAAVNDGNGSGNGIGVVVDNQQQQQQLANGSSNSNQKSTQAYKLYSEGYKPVEVAIQLGLSEKQATRYYTEYWKLKRLYKLHSIYKELKGNFSPILELYWLVKRKGIRLKDLDWFVNIVDIGTYKIPEIQKQYSKAKDELEVIEYKRVMSKHELDNMNKQIILLRRSMYQLSATCTNKRNEIAYLQNQIQVLEGHINGLENRNLKQQQQEEIQNESYA